MPLPLLAAAGISAGAGLLSGLFGKGDEPTQYKGNYYSLADLINAGYKPYDASVQKENNSQVIQNQMAFDKAGARMRAANAGYNTNQLLGQNNWANESGYVNSLLQANQAADTKASDENNTIAKYIFGMNADEKSKENYINWKMENEYNDDNFANRFLAGASIGAQAANTFSNLKLNAGGRVPINSGIPGKDSVNATLTPGETVINSEASEMTPDLLAALNKAGLAKRTETKDINMLSDYISGDNTAKDYTVNEPIKDTYTIYELEHLSQQNPGLYLKIIDMYRQGLLKIQPD